MNANTAPQDYAASGIAEIARRQSDAAAAAAAPSSADPATRTVARRLLSACIVVPALLWWLTSIGVGLHWYPLHVGAILFVCSVTAAFGLIVWFNVVKLSRLDAQRAQAQEQLKLAKDAAESANRFKSMFFANISHEIRTPLTAINGFAELLLNPDRTPDQRLADARVIRRNGEHLLTLINDILDLSRIEAGKMSVERVSASPAAIVGEVCSMLRARAAEKGLALDVDFAGQIPQRIQTDPMRLRQVLINLVANAIKFTRAGGVRVTVSVQPSFRAEKPLLEIRIADTGIGIPTEQQAVLFQPFVQGDASITRQYGGSGLGLAISLHFARLLGGDIALDSQPGRGSTFTVTVATGSLHNAAVEPDPRNAMESPDAFADPRVRIAGSVLVAEDGLDNQTLIATKLRDAGLLVEIVPNGQLACDKALDAAARGNPFDLILMDVQMPVMDGFAATLHLRNKGYCGPVIALTANAMERDRAKLLAAGCNDFVTKPIQMKALLKAIGRHLKITEAAAPSAAAPGAASTAGTSPASTPAARSQQFFAQLPTHLAQIEQALVREDRVRLREITQLLLGTAASAGLKDVAPQLAKLAFAAENDPAWPALRQAVAQFTRDAQPKPHREAA